MTYRNCAHLLAHYERAMQPDFVTGNPPIPLDDFARTRMAQAHEEMKAHIAQTYPDHEVSKTKGK